VYFFWAVLCDFIKRDSGETGSHTSRETSAAKAAAILSPIVGHFREIKAKAAQKEHGFREIVNCLNDPPYFYNMESILAFKTETGESLVELCGKEDFDDWLARQMMPVGDEMIPAIISFSGYDGSKFYVTKERFLLMIAQKVLETRGIVRYIIVQRWSRIIKAWQTEPAMDSDKEFDLLIHRIVRRRNHVLASLLTDPRLILAYHETAKTKDNAPGIKMLFGKEGLNPAPEIFDLDRAALLKETKAALPLRYTNKYLRAIFMFFSRLFNKKSDEEPEIEDNSEELKNESSREAALHALESALVPEEYTLDDYLDTLELRWNQIADGRRRKTSRNDVDTLIRNRVMGILGSRKRRVLTMDEISSAAQDIIDFSPSFQKIPGKKDLKAYVQVSMLKAMRCVSRKQ
jgi:hypothetical protein